MPNEQKNKVLYGICNVHIAKLIETDGEVTYGTPFPMPGATGLAFNPEGETNPFYADNTIYFQSTSNNGYTGDLVLAITPDEFLTQILGQTIDKNGAMIENSEDKNARFALMCELDGDANKVRHVFYDCLATRPSRDNTTNESSITPVTESMGITMKPRISDRNVKASLRPSTENKATYDKFFKSVYEKDATAVV